MALHYGVEPREITPEFVMTFNREKPRTVWYNTVKAIPTDMKLHDGILAWRTRSAQEDINSIDLKCQSPNLIMCLLAMDGLNNVMPPKIIPRASKEEIDRAHNAVMNTVDHNQQPGNAEAINNILQSKRLNFTENAQCFVGSKTSWPVLEAGLDRFIPLIRQHKEMVSQMFNIKINVIMSDHQTLKEKLALANAIFRKTFGLTLKGNVVSTGKPNIFELHLMDCFTYVDGALALKLPSGKIIKSYLNLPTFAPATPPDSGSLSLSHQGDLGQLHGLGCKDDLKCYLALPHG